MAEVLKMADYISREAFKGKYLCCGYLPEMPEKEFDEFPAADVAPVVHGRWIFTKRHLWYKDENGNIDEWRVDNGFHNGPECQICHTAFCEQCTPDWSTTECKIGHYYCSECAETSRDAQITMVFEEMAELQKELCKHARGSDNKAHIAEEIADCLIMLEQMQILFDIRDDVNKFTMVKLERLKERIDERDS